MAENLDYGRDTLSDSAKIILDRAIQECTENGQSPLTNEHLALAITQVEYKFFSFVMNSAGLDPNLIATELAECISRLDKAKGPLKLSIVSRILLKQARIYASGEARQLIEPQDIFAALVDDDQSVLVMILRRMDVDPQHIKMHISLWEREKERNILRFELPSYLKALATNLNMLAYTDKIPPVFGRDDEMNQVLRILCHKERPNSAILIGEAGVGKTAIAEGLARRLVYEPKKVPVRIRNCQIVNLQMNAVVSGTMLRGMFEDRMQNVIREIKEHPDLIIFIDEIHTMIGAGSALGAPADATDILKDVLARGQVRIIGSTTLEEYKRYILEDSALARRFRPVYIDEPSIAETRDILYRLRPRLQENYNVKITDEAIEAALELSARYQRNLRLPDKAIGIIDTAAVQVEIKKTKSVEAQDIKEVIADITRIPINLIARNITTEFKDIESRLSSRVMGQPAAIKALADRLFLNKGPLKQNFYRPDGVLLFLGPTGVGKTELARSISEFLFGDETKMIRLDMSEYTDPSSVDKLIGSHRGIIGSEQGGLLTTRIRDNPYAVILLDEIEKAHPNVRNILLTALDEGWITDGRGKRVYLSDSIVIMISNFGSDHWKKLASPLGFLSGPVNYEQVMGRIQKELKDFFSPEFINRIDDVVIFHPLSDADVYKITKKFINAIKNSLSIEGKVLDVDENALFAISKKGYSLEYGARYLYRTIEKLISIPISRRLDSKHFHVMLKDGELVIRFNGNEIRALSGDKEYV